MNELDDFIKKLNAIKALELETIEPNEIINELKQFDRQIALTLVLKKGTAVCRTRILGDIDKDIPTSVHQISYNPTPSSNYGRAHLKGETVFYASISTERMKDYFNTPFEVFDFNNENIDRQYFVTSKWILQQDITIVDIGNTLVHDSERIKERKKFIDNIQTQSATFLQSSKLFDDFLSEEFSKRVDKGEEHLYKLSASYCSWMFSLGFKGILYSSVGSNGAGLNVALHPSLVDEGLLIPHLSVLGTMYNRYGEYINEYCMKAHVDNDTLRWQEVYDALPPEMKLYYTGKSDNNSFQNKIPIDDLGNNI